MSLETGLSVPEIEIESPLSILVRAHKVSFGLQSPHNEKRISNLRHMLCRGRLWNLNNCVWYIRIIFYSTTGILNTVHIYVIKKISPEDNKDSQGAEASVSNKYTFLGAASHRSHSLASEKCSSKELKQQRMHPEWLFQRTSLCIDHNLANGAMGFVPLKSGAGAMSTTSTSPPT